MAFVAQRWDNIWRFQGAEHGSIKSNMSKHVDVVCSSYRKRSRYRNCVSIFLTQTYIYRYFWIYTEKPVLACALNWHVHTVASTSLFFRCTSCNKQKKHMKLTFFWVAGVSTLLHYAKTPGLIIPKGLRSKPPSRLKDKGWAHSSNENSGSRQWVQVSHIITYFCISNVSS